MWKYEKKLEFMVNITKKDLKMANYLVTQYGGPDGELRAAVRYLNQRYTMPTEKGKALLTEIATEELGHVEIISTMLYQLTKDATVEELKNAGLGKQYAEHKKSIFPSDAFGVPYSTYGIGAKGDYIADLTEDMAAEEKARATYEALMDLTDDPDVLAPLAFLREREIVHFERFGELLMQLKEMEKQGLL